MTAVDEVAAEVAVIDAVTALDTAFQRISARAGGSWRADDPGDGKVVRRGRLRRRAHAALAGSGSFDRIVKADVIAALASGSAPTEQTLVPSSTGRPSAPSRVQAQTAKGEVNVVELSEL